MNLTLKLNRSGLIFVGLLFLSNLLCANTTPPEVKVILTANTADLKDIHTLVAAIDTYCRQNTNTPIWWILNGDTFLPETPEKEIASWREQVIALLHQHDQLHILINQGDREWNESGQDGWSNVSRIEIELRKHKHPRLHIAINEGCPGPETISLAPYLDIVVINSQWFNHPYKKPAPSMDVCPVADIDVFMEEIQNILDETENKNLLLLSHYPLESLGNYGGRFPLSSYIFPPLVGNIKAAYHQNIGTDKDIINKNFNDIRLRMLGMLADYSSLIVASGHEQNNTVLRAGKNFFINSGALAEGGFAAHSKRAKLASNHAGFMEVTYTESGEISYRFIPTETNIDATDKQILINAPCDNTNLPDKNEVYQPCKETILPAEKMSGTYPASITLAAGPEYKAGGFKKKLLGRHYRNSWTTPVKTSYLNLDTTFGGLVVDKIGGGRQTTSLKMVGGNGKEYVFRSVDKDPTKALNYAWRGTLISDVIKDQTTTQQPYGALAAAYLLNKIDILHATPHLYILPKDDKLGPFKDKYGNLFGLLEDRPNDKIAKGKIFAGATHIEKSYKMVEKVTKDYHNTLDQKEFCHARIFDILVGDWGKHEDNWKWAGFKTDSGELFRPIPRDRDHVFSRWDGILPYLADREWAKPSGENFDYKIKGLNSLMWQARHLDRFATNSLTKTDWINAAVDIQHAITEADIDQAVAQMPQEIYNADGKEIAAKLKARLKDLPRYAGEYYDMLAHEVDINGTNKPEYFHIVRQPDGSTTVTLYPLAKNDSTASRDKVLYKRTFYPTETKEIRIFGLAGHDVYEIEGSGADAIFIRVIGGDGEDSINDRSTIAGAKHSTWVYDQELATTVTGSQAVLIKPKDEARYNYRRTAFAYNTYFPVALISYNPFNGLSVSAGVTFRRHRFDKPGFHTIHNLKGAVSTQGNYEISYSNRLRYLVGKWDGTGTILLSRPLNYNYFFGIGNETTYDKSKPSKYYRTQYNSSAVSYGLTRDFWKQSNVTITANYEGDKGIPRRNSYLGEHTDIPGTEKYDLVFARAAINLDFRDNIALPERGFHISMTQQAGHISHGHEQVFAITELEAEQYISTHNANPFTLGLRAGGGRNHGDLPFYKLFSLGQLNDLQGYKRNRFTGQSKAFINTELRKQLVQTHNNLIPLRLGIRGFFDMGRVWSDNEPDGHTWHTGYGGGIYVVPFKEQFAVNLSVGSSKEESLLFMFTIGSFIK